MDVCCTNNQCLGILYISVTELRQLLLRKLYVRKQTPSKGMTNLAANLEIKVMFLLTDPMDPRAMLAGTSQSRVTSALHVSR